MSNGTLKSPINYVGGKYKLLPQLLPLFPSNIDTVVDLFTGGLDIALNTSAQCKICNDKEAHIIDLYTNFQNLDGETVHNKIIEVVGVYNLSKANREGYNQLRIDYNMSPTWDKFYGLITHSFSHQIRFNRKGEFNMPFGTDRSCYNIALQSRLKQFVDSLDDTYTFINQDFRVVDMNQLTPNSFVYCDPPYLITTAAYNESNGWSEQDEQDLLSLLDSLHARGIKFGLSNVLEMGDKSNDILKAWMTKYTIHNLSFNYNNSSYHKKSENKKNTSEVFVVNY